MAAVLARGSSRAVGAITRRRRGACPFCMVMAKPSKEEGAVALPRFQMVFEPMTIEHLGLRLYSRLPPVLSELVSNAYDGESPKVEITLPDGNITSDSEVIVRDYGHGMTPDEVQEEYLPIGRCRRGADAKAMMSKNAKVRVTGRKGLGKLAAFGVATEVELRSVKDRQAVCLRLNYDDMQRWMRERGRQPYEPTVVARRSGKTDDPDGVEVKLRKLHRRTPVSADDIRHGLARRLSFISAGFQVTVNGKPIGPGDRVQRRQCPEGFSWKITDIPGNGDLGGGLTVKGWLGFLAESSQVGRGVDVFATGKAVELESFFNLPSTHAQFARAHVVGEVHADFLDAQLDLVATARNSVVWESDAGQALQKWGRETLRWAFEQWLELRRRKKEQEVIKAAAFDKWMSTRPEREQKVAQRLIRLLVDDPKMDSESAIPLLDVIKGSVETMAFNELVEAIEQEGALPKTLLRLFAEWRVIEAREHLKLADGRVAAIEQLAKFIETGALEVKELQPLLVENIWMLDPAWTEASVQPTYTKLLRKTCKEPKGPKEEDRRLDILGITAAGVLTVVELKRPEKKLSREDLEQIERYVDWARDNLGGTGPDSPRAVTGLLLVGELAGGLSRKIERLAGSDIRVQTYRDLHKRAREYYGQIEKILKAVAPEYLKRRAARSQSKS